MRGMPRLPRIERFSRWPKIRSVTGKFVVIYVSILTVSIAVMGYFLYFQVSRSAIAQGQSVMEQNLLQTKNNIAERIGMIENLSQIISYDPKIQHFLGNVFVNQPFELVDYRDNIAPILDNLMRQNTYIHSIRIYMENPSIPELYDSFYHIDRISGRPPYKDFIGNKTRTSMWIDLHEEHSILNLPGTDRKDEVFAYDRKIFSSSFTNMAGMLEIEVNESVLFGTLKQIKDGGNGRIFVIGGSNRVVSDNVPAYYKHSLSELHLPPLPLSGKTNAITKVNGKPSIVISMPIYGPDLRLVGIFPVQQFERKVKNSQKGIALILLLSLLLLSILVYVVTNALLSRMKVLVRAMKLVQAGSLDVSVPVAGRDEFTQMAQNFNHMTSRLHELVERVYKSRILEKEAELRLLESQINPHFLYNTLATISWAARKVKSPEITHLANSLAKFYRLVLSKGKSAILIRDEIEMVKVYLQIQKFRFEDLFDVVFKIEDEVMAYYTVKNILQPLVENALTHGIEPKRSHGTIIVKAGMKGEALYFQIIDDGVGIAPGKIDEILEGKIEKSSGSGYAVRNIMERLKAYYGDEQQFEIFSKPGIGTVVTITFAKGGEFAHVEDAYRGG